MAPPSPTAAGSDGALVATPSRNEKFSGTPNELLFGRPQQAALGMAHTLRVPEATLSSLVAQGAEALVAEIESRGTESDRECLDYVLHQRAGLSAKVFPNGARDVGRNGETFADFVAHPSAVTAELTPAEVLALRLYTTAVYRSLNAPCRDTSQTRAAHPLAATVACLSQGIKKLRAVGASSADANKPLTLWRGLADLRITDEFMERGGTELGCMSTSAAADVAVRYACAHDSCDSGVVCLLRLNTASFMDRGADLAFLSAFPEEAEFLYPPGTYLRPLGASEVHHVAAAGIEVTVVDVAPTFPT